MAQENSDMGIVKSDIKDMAAGNGKAAETKGIDADKKGRKTKKENDESGKCPGIVILNCRKMIRI